MEEKCKNCKTDCKTLASKDGDYAAHRNPWGSGIIERFWGIFYEHDFSKRCYECDCNNPELMQPQANDGNKKQ